jgi:hypothetical protein
MKSKKGTPKAVPGEIRQALKCGCVLVYKHTRTELCDADAEVATKGLGALFL